MEIKDCIGNSNEKSRNLLNKITYFAKDFLFHGCQLTFKELASIMDELVLLLPL